MWLIVSFLMGLKRWKQKIFLTGESGGLTIRQTAQETDRQIGRLQTLGDRGCDFLLIASFLVGLKGWKDLLVINWWITSTDRQTNKQTNKTTPWLLTLGDGGCDFCLIASFLMGLKWWKDLLVMGESGALVANDDLSLGFFIKALWPPNDWNVHLNVSLDYKYKPNQWI